MPAVYFRVRSFPKYRTLMQENPPFSLENGGVLHCLAGAGAGNFWARRVSLFVGGMAFPGDFVLKNRAGRYTLFSTLTHWRG